MESIALEAILIVILVIANGVFSMCEIAVVAARKSSLQQRAAEGSRRARIAFELSQNPNQFLSTVQIGITVIGTLAGAFGGLTIAEKLAGYLAQFPSISEYAEGISFAVVVIAHLGRIPAVADSIETNKLRFEVMDMDGKRVDRVLITRLPETDPDS